MLSVLPFTSRAEERPFKSYNPPPTTRTTMSSFPYASSQQQTNTTNPYYTPYSQSSMTPCMTSSRPEMTSSMYGDHNNPQQSAFPQWGDYSINNMLKKHQDYTPNVMPQILDQKQYTKPASADSTTKTESHTNSLLNRNVSNNDANNSTNTSPTPSQDDKTSSDEDKTQEPPKKRLNTVSEDLKDGSYFDRRRKNNESARRSRDNRKAKEEQIAMRVIYLEQENLQLRTEVSLLKADIDKLRCMLYNS